MPQEWVDDDVLNALEAHLDEHCAAEGRKVVRTRGQVVCEAPGQRLAVTAVGNQRFTPEHGSPGGPRPVFPGIWRLLKTYGFRHVGDYEGYGPVRYASTWVNFVRGVVLICAVEERELPNVFDPDALAKPFWPPRISA